MDILPTPPEPPASKKDTTIILREYESNDVSYEFIATTFKKTSRLPLDIPFDDGTVFVWFHSWNHERITNEAKALRLVTFRRAWRGDLVR